MAVSDSYREFVLEQLGRVRPVTTRRMFGGVGIYAEGAFFALMDNDTLFFKVDDSTRPEFEARGAKPFQPFGEGTTLMTGYYEVPAEVLERVDLLAGWMAKSIRVAETKAKEKAERRRAKLQTSKLKAPEKDRIARSKPGVRATRTPRRS
jgi:DNA transformation protein